MRTTIILYRECKSISNVFTVMAYRMVVSYFEVSIIDDQFTQISPYCNAFRLYSNASFTFVFFSGAVLWTYIIVCHCLMRENKPWKTGKQTKLVLIIILYQCWKFSCHKYWVQKIHNLLHHISQCHLQTPLNKLSH